MGIRTVASTLTKHGLDIAALPIGAAAGLQASLRIACHRRPMPMPRQFSNLLEHPLRLSYRNPLRLLQRMGMGEGETVVDLGCGIGTFTQQMARLVGATGTVHAVDIQPELLNQAETHMHSLGFHHQIHFHLASAANLPLATESVDMVALIATSGELSDPIVCIDEIFRILKPGGRVMVSEELADPGYVSAQTSRRWLTDAGFELFHREGNFLCYADLYLKPAQSLPLN